MLLPPRQRYILDPYDSIWCDNYWYSDNRVFARWECDITDLLAKPHRYTEVSYYEALKTIYSKVYVTHSQYQINGGFLGAHAYMVLDFKKDTVEYFDKDGGDPKRSTTHFYTEPISLKTILKNGDYIIITEGEAKKLISKKEEPMENFAIKSDSQELRGAFVAAAEKRGFLNSHDITGSSFANNYISICYRFPNSIGHNERDVYDKVFVLPQQWDEAISALDSLRSPKMMKIGQYDATKADGIYTIGCAKLSSDDIKTLVDATHTLKKINADVWLTKNDIMVDDIMIGNVDEIYSALTSL